MTKLIDAVCAEAVVKKLITSECTPFDKQEALDNLHSIPAADVQEITHGKWIKEHFDSESGEFYHTCSNCNMELKETYLDNYCPNCGAKMDGDVNPLNKREIKSANILSSKEALNDVVPF